MNRRSAPAASRARLAILLGAALLSPSAFAQDGDGPLRFLRPAPDSGVQVFGAPAEAEAEAEAEALEPSGPPDAEDIPAADPEPAALRPPEGEPIQLPDPSAEPSPEVQFGAEPETIQLPRPEPDGEAAVSAPVPTRDAASARTDSDPGKPPQNGVQVVPREPEARPLRLGVLAGRDVGRTMAIAQTVTAGLAEALERPVEILPMLTYGAMIDAQRSQRIDGGFYSAAAYALAEAQCRCLEPIVAPEAADGTVAYYAIIVAAPESRIATFADLSGKTVAVGPGDSIGGRRMQMAALASQDFDLAASVAAVRETASAAEAVSLVAEGEADAAFAWSSLEGEQESGYSRGTLTDLVASGAITMDEVAVIWRSPAISHGPFALAKVLPDADKRRIEEYLVGLDAALPAAYDLLSPFYSGGYVAVEPDDYRGLAALAAADMDAVKPPRGQPEAGGPGD